MSSSSSIHGWHLEASWTVIVVVVASSLAACSGANTPHDSPTPKTGADVPTHRDRDAVSHVDGEVDTGVVADVGDGDHDSSSDGNARSDGDTKTAWVVIEQFPVPDSRGRRFTVVGAFSKGKYLVKNGDCRVEHVDQCHLQICDKGTRATVSAGALELNTSVASLEIPHPHVGPYVEEGDSLLWNSDDTLAIRATGAEVPSFETSLDVVPEATLEKPLLPERDQILTIDRTRDLKVEWSPISGSQEMFLVGLASENSEATKKINCFWPADAGSGVVPSELIQQMADSKTGFQIGAGDRKVVQTGAWRVEVLAIQIADDDSSSTGMAQGPLEFE